MTTEFLVHFQSHININIKRLKLGKRPNNRNKSIWHTIFRLFISSSIGFFFGIIRLIRARCIASNILLKICNTSSDDLKVRHLLAYENPSIEQISKISYLKWYALSTSSKWWIASWRWLAASWICWSFHGEPGLMDVRWAIFCTRCTLKHMS